MDPPHDHILAVDFLTSSIGIATQMGALGLIAFACAWLAKKFIDENNARTTRLEEITNARALRLEDENRKLNELIREQLVPALTASTAAIENCMRMIAEGQRREELARELDRRREGREREQRGRDGD